MAEVWGTTWIAEYGEISDREQFRVGYVGQQVYEAYFPIGQLSDLIAVLQGVVPLGLNVLSLGTQVQAKKVSAGFPTEVVLEPRSDTFPVEIMRYDFATNSDLISVLQGLQAAVGNGDGAGDWDGGGSGQIPQKLMPDYLQPEQLEITIDVRAVTQTLLPVGATGRSVSPIVRGAIPDYSGRLTVAGTGTDNRAAIQAALDAASQPDGGGRYGSYWFSYLQRRAVTVKLPAGHYYISAPSDGSPSLKVPEHVEFDFSEASLYFQYPASTTTAWAAIQLYKSGSVKVGTMAPVAGTTPPDTKRLYDGIRVVGTDNVQGAVEAGQGHAEIKGFQGGSIRLIGAWVTRIRGINFTSDWGIVLSSLPASNVYGITIPSDMESAAARGVTDLFVDDCYFQTRRGGIYGPIVPDDTGGATGVGGSSLDYSLGALQLYMTNCGFEHFNALPIQVTGYVVSLVNCFWEECGSCVAFAAWFDTVRSIYVQNFRWNYTGMSVPGPSGNGIPAPPYFFRMNGVRSFIVDGGYAHNTYLSNVILASSNTGTFPDSYDVQGVYTDDRAYATDIVYAGSRLHSMSGRWNLGHVVMNGWHLWPDASGIWRTKNSAPASDTDGTVVGTQT